jgi:hypothetical protein
MKFGELQLWGYKSCEQWLKKSSVVFKLQA